MIVVPIAGNYPPSGHVFITAANRYEMYSKKVIDNWDQEKALIYPGCYVGK